MKKIMLLSLPKISCVASGLDGRLQKATKLKGIKNFKASEMGLLPVPIDTWQGFAFIQPGKQRQVLHRHSYDTQLLVCICVMIKSDGNAGLSGKWQDCLRTCLAHWVSAPNECTCSVPSFNRIAG